MIEQALQVLESQPAVAEEMLLLADSAGSNPEVLGALAQAQFQQAKLAEAEVTARKWTKLRPTNMQAWEKLAAIQRSQNRIVRAQDTLKSGIASLTEARDRDALRGQLIEYYLLADDNGNAFSLNEDFETDTARDAFRKSLSYAQLLRLNGKFSEAYEVIQAHLDRDDKSMPARMLRGVVLLDQQLYAPAAEDLAAVITQSPDNKEAHYKLAMALRGLNRLEEATKHLNISRDLTDQLEKQMQPNSAH